MPRQFNARPQKVQVHLRLDAWYWLLACGSSRSSASKETMNSSQHRFILYKWLVAWSDIGPVRDNRKPSHLSLKRQWRLFANLLTLYTWRRRCSLHSRTRSKSPWNWYNALHSHVVASFALSYAACALYYTPAGCIGARIRSGAECASTWRYWATCRWRYWRRTWANEQKPPCLQISTMWRRGRSCGERLYRIPVADQF